MTIPLPDPESIGRPAYRSLAEHTARSIADGALKPGDRLPPHRELAYQVGLSVQTVSKAFEELTRRQLVRGEIGRGSFVAGRPAEAAQPFIVGPGADGPIDLSMLKPVMDDVHRRAMEAALADLGGEIAAPLLFSFRPNVALARHRKAGASWLKRLGLATKSSDNILPTNGATPAITTALLTAVRPGEALATEAIGHHTLRPLARHLGVTLKPIALDDEGIRPDALADAAREPGVKAVFLMPGGAGPTAAVMTRERRNDIIEIARRYDLLIIENDPLGPLIEHGEPPIAALAPERCLYITSFTKCVMPGLRAGYLVLPDRMVAAAANRHLVTNWMATPLIAEIAARWVEDGTTWRLIAWQRQALARRQALASEMLDVGGAIHQPSGMHLWLPLPALWNVDAFVGQARLQHVAIAPGHAFAMTDDVEVKAVRVCTGGVSEPDLQKGMAVLARLLHSEPEPALLAI
jgi:DNA-binding transcriptional MocR family regulator